MTCETCNKQRSKKGKLFKGEDVSDSLKNYKAIGTVSEIEELIDAVADLVHPEVDNTFSVLDRVYLAMLKLRDDIPVAEEPVEVEHVEQHLIDPNIPPPILERDSK